MGIALQHKAAIVSVICSACRSHLFYICVLKFQHFFPQAFANVSSDGFEGDFIANIYRGTDRQDTLLAQAFSQHWRMNGRPEMEVEEFPLPNTGIYFSDFLRSDHRNFWNYGIPAIFLTDSGKCICQF